VQRLQDVQVRRGVRLDQFEEETFALDLAVVHQEGGKWVRVSDSAGQVRFAAHVVVEDALATPSAWSSPIGLSSSPWPSKDALYSDNTLFHGPAFQAIDEVVGLGPQGAVAMLRGGHNLGWSGSAWQLDVPALDACLQLALLWGLQVAGGQSLPMRIAEVVRYHEGLLNGPLRCELVARSATAHKTVSDIRLMTEQGVPCVDLRGVEMYVVPGGTASSETKESTA